MTLRWFFTICLLVTALHGSPDAHDIIELGTRADKGDATAQYYLGLMYDNGDLVVQDDKQAVFWYRKAADQGEARAQSNLGTMYVQGRGVTQDGEQAMFWYLKAAGQIAANSQIKLGDMFNEAQGYVQAHMWYNLAAADSTGETHERAARNRSIVEKKMTPQQVAEAQRLAGEWQVRQP